MIASWGGQLVAPVKVEAESQELMQQRTMSHVEQLKTKPTEGKRRRANPDEEAQRKQQKCDMRKHFSNKQQAGLVHTSRQSNNEQ